MVRKNLPSIEYLFRLVFLIFFIILLIVLIYLILFQFPPNISLVEASILTLLCLLIIIFGICGLFFDKIKSLLIQLGKNKVQLNLEKKVEEKIEFERSSEVIPNDRIQQIPYNENIDNITRFPVASQRLLEIEPEFIEVKKGLKSIQELLEALEENNE